ncbi:MAG TPA: pyrroloquinoline quinone-dependent dehydrogenase, partial [Gemmatimonadetes bacterium]|nr:pyrroloquinoline quinone-dependent dehydrogenase [Gemmatimonadota bacterium]
MEQRSVAAFLVFLLLPSVLPAQGTANGEWHVYGGDAAHTRYTPLDQIDASNASDLEIVWRWNARNFGPNPFAQTQATPLMIKGVLYATVGMRRSVVAIDPGTGETLWIWRIDEGERLQAAPRPNSGRGVAYWEDPD